MYRNGSTDSGGQAVSYHHSEPKCFFPPLPAVPPDIGYAHVALWRVHQRNLAWKAAADQVGEEIRSGRWSPIIRKPSTAYRPAPRIDDADFMDGDLEMY